MKKEKKGLKIKAALLLIGLLPIVTLAACLSTYACITLMNEVKSETYNKLEVAAENVSTYFNYDLVNWGSINYDDYSDHTFIESAQKLDIEMTLFEGNIRFTTSLKKDDGTYNEGSKAGEGIWEAVSKGQKYTSDSTVIGGKAYYVCYVPVYDASGKVWGMGFAGTPQAKIKKMLNSVAVQIVMITVILVAVYTAIIIFVSRKIYNAITKSVDSLSVLATGDMNADTQFSSNIIEINQIIGATENLKGQLRESAGGAKTTAIDLNGAVKSVDELASKSASETSLITHSMEELATTAQNLAETVQDANAYVIDMGEAITSITEKADVSATDAENMRSVNTQVVDVIANVKQSNERSVDAIRQIGILTNECKQAVEAIKTAADEITGIAGQTNLLALNASIESARAGEAGRGFAVVAENIKNLAMESADSSSGISSRVNDIILRVDKCVEAAEAAAALMEEQNGLVVQAGESMGRLSESVVSVADNISVITDEAKRLDKAKEKVLNNISDLSAISEENAASSEQVSASVDDVASAIEGVKGEANKMRELAVQLEAKMEFFKL